MIAAVVGLAFALYLSHVERDILQVWCLYCVISQGIIALLTLLSLLAGCTRKSEARGNKPS